MRRVIVFVVLAGLVTAILGSGGCEYEYDGPRSKNLEIRTWYDLHAVRDNLRGHHRLMNDLDATSPGYEELASPTANSGQGWEPIGIVTGPVGGPLSSPFSGTFDGQGFRIVDVFIHRANSGTPQPVTQTALFGCVEDGGVVTDLVLENVSITGDSSVGALVGINRGDVSECYVSGTVSGQSAVGGLVGYNEGTVSESLAISTVSGEVHIGGLVGSNYRMVINCYAAGSVTGTNYVGGLVGFLSLGSVRYSYSRANVSGEQNVGGLVGSQGMVLSSFWDVQTSGQEISGGGTGKTAVELMDMVTFTDTESEGLDEPWDIVDVAHIDQRNPTYIWNIVDGEAYPFLSWEPVWQLDSD